MNKNDLEKQTARANAAQQRRTVGQQRAQDFDWPAAFARLQAMFVELGYDDGVRQP